MHPMGDPTTVIGLISALGYIAAASAIEALEAFSPNGDEFRAEITTDDPHDLEPITDGDLIIYQLQRRDRSGRLIPFELVIMDKGLLHRLIITDPTDLALVCPRTLTMTERQRQLLIPAVSVGGLIVVREVYQTRQELRFLKTRAARQLIQSLQNPIDYPHPLSLDCILTREYVMTLDQPTPWSEAGARDVLFRCKRHIVRRPHASDGHERISTLWTMIDSDHSLSGDGGRVMARGLQWSDPDHPEAQPYSLVQMGHRVFTGDAATRLLTIGTSDPPPRSTQVGAGHRSTPFNPHRR